MVVDYWIVGGWVMGMGDGNGRMGVRMIYLEERVGT